MSPQRIEMTDGFVFYSPSERDARFIYQEIFRHETYSLAGLPDAPVVVDVGANVGLFSLYTKQVRPKARVLAFEPAPENLEAMRLNVELHDVTDVTVHECGLGSRTGEATFTYYPNLPGNSTFTPQDKAMAKDLMAARIGRESTEQLYTPTELVVRVERLSRVLAEHHPDVDTVDLLKIDVEGTELDVLLGIDDADWPKVRAVELEVQDTAGSRLADIETLLRDQGFLVTSELHPLMPQNMRFFNVAAVR
ncbi:FkbM family methyltransferase [Dactylosporangium sp. CA-233914]|uniref:FkbM family methyltransferase n=1 Tax=Dactylosporangium sp. CA-233914 TaxID=3239934 RepID=UPI003D910BFC